MKRKVRRSIVAAATVAMTLSALVLSPSTAAHAGPEIICGLRDAGCFQAKGDTSLYYTRQTGPTVVKGLIRDHWGRHGWENGFLAYPTNYETCGLTQGGCWSNFQGGAIYYSPNVGAHFVRGLVREKWISTGSGNGFLQYPRTDEFCGLSSGRYGQHYEGENGSVYFSQVSGTHVMRGLIKSRWAELGWE